MSFEAGRHAWLDHKKTREQLRPARMAHRAADVTEDVEQSRADAASVTKNMATGVVSVGGSDAFWVYHGGVRPIWSSLRHMEGDVSMRTPIEGLAAEGGASSPSTRGVRRRCIWA